MITALLDPGSFPFAVALLVMLGLVGLELLSIFFGVGISEGIDRFVLSQVDLDPSGASHASGLETTASGDLHSPLSRFLAWLYVGRVPALMVLIVFLSAYGLLGLAVQAVALQFLSASLPAWIAGFVVLMPALPATRFSVALLARIMPRDETSAVSPESFIGHTAIVTGGDARSGFPAQARLQDRFGTYHYFLIEPEDAAEVLPQGSWVLLVRKLPGGRFSAIPNPNPVLTDDPP